MNAPAQLVTLEKLPAREAQRRAELEHVIAQELGSFLRVGAALAEINALRLYRDTHHTFEEYLADKWDLGRSRGYQLIDTHVVADHLSTNCGQKLLPQNEAQFRPLVKYKDEPEKLAEIWGRAVETAPGGRITARHVQQTMFAVEGKEKSEKTQKLRSRTRKEAGLSESFLNAAEALLQEVERARNNKYKCSSREAIAEYLDGVREVVANDGQEIADPVALVDADLAKLLDGGFAILRRNEDNMCIERRNYAGTWLLHTGCSGMVDMDARWKILMRDPKNIRG